MRGANLFRIIADNFQPYTFRKGRRTSGASILIFGLIPLVAGIAIAWYAKPISSTANDIYVAVFAVVGAVLTALLAVVQTVVGATDKTRYDAGAKLNANKTVIRLEVLRELYANIAFTVLTLVLASLPLILLEIDSIPSVVRRVASGAVYVVCVQVFVTFLHIISGVYLVLDVQAEDTNQELTRLAEQAEQKRTD